MSGTGSLSYDVRGHNGKLEARRPGGGEFASWALDVSADGSVVVGWGTSDQGREAFRWTAAEGMVGLGDLPRADFRSEALAVSADGSTIVGYSSTTRGNEAFRWTASDGMVALDPGPTGVYTGKARGVSADGSVIVGGEGLAYIWDEVNGSRSIHAILEESGIDLGDWWLKTVSDVSADGTVVIGRGINPDGFEEGWIATLPRQGCASAADFDCDGDIDLADYLEFIRCFEGRSESPSLACGGADTDGDNDVDLADLVSFQAQFTGPR